MLPSNIVRQWHTDLSARETVSSRLRVVALSPRVEVEAEQHGDEHGRAHQASQPLDQTALGNEAEPGQTDQQDSQNDWYSRHLQGGAPLHPTKTHPGGHGQGQEAGDHQRRQLRKPLDQVGIADECCAPEKQHVQGDSSNAARHAHLHEVPEEVPNLRKARGRSLVDGQAFCT